jgi:hypothetical protein
MPTHEIKQVLLWCAGINYVLLIVWFGVFVLGHDWMYRLHSRWFGFSVEIFDAINYAGLAVFKIGIMLFYLTPLIALSILY